MNGEKQTQALLTLDPVRNRIRIHRQTIRLLGNPAYVLIPARRSFRKIPASVFKIVCSVRLLNRILHLCLSLQHVILNKVKIAWYEKDFDRCSFCGCSCCVMY